MFGMAALALNNNRAILDFRIFPSHYLLSAQVEPSRFHERAGRRPWLRDRSADPIQE
jgi:hypothetical protein